MISVVVNMATVFVGSVLGLLLKKGIPERVSKAVMTAIGLCTLYIGISGALKGEKTIVLILSLVFGTIIGTIIDVDSKLEKIGKWIEKKLNRGKEAEGKTTIAEGFVTGSLLFCVGAMTIVGSINAGISGDNELIYTKSIMDLFSSCMLASALGVGVVFSVFFILFFQGGLVLLAGLLQNVLTDTVLINELTCCGSVMIIGLGLNIIGITKIKVANFLPALIFVPILYYLSAYLPI